MLYCISGFLSSDFEAFHPLTLPLHVFRTASFGVQVASRELCWYWMGRALLRSRLKARSSAKSHCRARVKLRSDKYTKILPLVSSCCEVNVTNRRLRCLNLMSCRSSHSSVSNCLVWLPTATISNSLDLRSWDCSKSLCATEFNFEIHMAPLFWST